MLCFVYIYHNIMSQDPFLSHIVILRDMRTSYKVVNRGMPREVGRSGGNVAKTSSSRLDAMWLAFCDFFGLPEFIL